MKRLSVMVVAGATALATALLVVRPLADDAPDSPAALSSLESMALPFATLAEPPTPIPDARFSRSIFAATSMPGSGVMLDLCRGPVAIDLGETYPLLIAEHDYCGGSAWIPELKEGDGVELSGKGVDAGLYVVSEIAYGERRVARFSDLPDATVALQTCISGTEIVMVGLEPVLDPLAV